MPDAPPTVFLLGRFFLANRQFVGLRENNFWQYDKHTRSFRKFEKFVEISDTTLVFT